MIKAANKARLRYSFIFINWVKQNTVHWSWPSKALSHLIQKSENRPSQAHRSRKCTAQCTSYNLRPNDWSPIETTDTHPVIKEPSSPFAWCPPQRHTGIEHQQRSLPRIPKVELLYGILPRSAAIMCKDIFGQKQVVGRMCRKFTLVESRKLSP